MAGTYVVAQCDSAQPGFADAHFDRTTGAYYEMTRGCSSAELGRALRIDNIAAAPVGAEGRIRFSAPAGAGIVGVSAEASLREDAGHRARLAFIDAAGNQAGRVATGSDDPGGFSRYAQRLDGVGRAGLAALLVCAEQRPCPESEQARVAIRNVRLTVKDHSKPTVAGTGTMLGGGWVRGARTLGGLARDEGAGLRTLTASSDGSALPISKSLPCAIAAGGVAGAMSPCPHAASTAGTLDTSRPPFHDGLNVIRVCAHDYGEGANVACDSDHVMVDNTAPVAAFRQRSQSDPELIAADVADATSGLAAASISYRPLAGGNWRTLPTQAVPGGIAGRIDSESVAPGRYAFRILAADRAGNGRVVATNRDGSPMVLELPLLARTSIRARIAALGHRARYGERPRLRGRISAAGGVDVSGLPLVLVERFEPGSRPRLKRRAITSGAGGSIRARLSKGPSRRVTVRFAGSRRLSASHSRARKLAVMGRVRMRISRKRVPAGGLVRFTGRVGTAGARVPAPGKVVELQVREPGQGRYRTVGQALHSGRTGKVRTSYRFGRFYRKPARFKFRFKVTRQADWPYRAPTHSRAKRLVVEPR